MTFPVVAFAGMFGARLPRNRQKCTFSDCPCTPPIAPPPTTVSLAVLLKKLQVEMLQMPPAPAPETFTPPPTEPATLFEKVVPVIVTVPMPL